MRIVFDFELFNDVRINNNLIEILLAFKKRIPIHLNDIAHEIQYGGAIIIVLKNDLITSEIMGFEQDTQSKIIEKLRDFDYIGTISDATNRNSN